MLLAFQFGKHCVIDFYRTLFRFQFNTLHLVMVVTDIFILDYRTTYSP
jgi:hypothetical protein